MQTFTVASKFNEKALSFGIAVVGAALATSLFYTPIPLAILLCIPACAYFITRPYELLLVMVFLIPFNFIVPVAGVPLAVELLKVLLWIPFLLNFTRSKVAFRTIGYNKCLAIVGALIIASLFRANDLPFTVKESIRLGSNIGLCYLVVNLLTTRQQVLQVLRVLIVSVVLVVLYGLYQFAIQDYGPLFLLVNPRIDTALAHGRDAFWLWRNRMISVLTSEMELAHYFNLCIPLGVALWLTEGRKRIRSKWLWATVLTLTGLVLTFTFGAWLTLAATVTLFLFFLEKKARWKIFGFGFSAFVIVGGLLALGPFREFMVDKISGTGMNSLAWDAVTRFDVWLFALQTWWAHPLFGVGIGNFEVLYTSHPHVVSEWTPAGSSPHQTFLYLLVMFGIVGTACILIVIFGTIRRNLKLRADPEFGVIALTLAFSLTTTLIGGFSDDSGFFGPHAGYLVWLLLGASAVIQRLAPRASRKPLSLRSTN